MCCWSSIQLKNSLRCVDNRRLFTYKTSPARPNSSPGHRALNYQKDVPSLWKWPRHVKTCDHVKMCLKPARFSAGRRIESPKLWDFQLTWIWAALNYWLDVPPRWNSFNVALTWGFCMQVPGSGKRGKFWWGRLDITIRGLNWSIAMACRWGPYFGRIDGGKPHNKLQDIVAFEGFFLVVHEQPLPRNQKHWKLPQQQEEEDKVQDVSPCKGSRRGYQIVFCRVGVCMYECYIYIIYGMYEYTSKYKVKKLQRIVAFKLLVQRAGWSSDQVSSTDGQWIASWIDTTKWEILSKVTGGCSGVFPDI